MRCCGNSKPELRIALRTRSRLSRTVASGRPTIVKPGRPKRDVDFDVHRDASMPKTAAVRTQASMRSARMQRSADAAKSAEFSTNRGAEYTR